MKTNRGRLTAWLGLWLTISAVGSAQSAAPPTFPCFKHHGRMSSGSNGIPTRIWLIGTNRVVAVGGRYTLPENGDRYLDPTTPDYSYIYGDFELCPEEPDVVGTMRHVLLVGAEHLVVENIVDSSRPPFKLLSTWPKRDRGASRKAP
jgi:hypothetical protein